MLPKSLTPYPHHNDLPIAVGNEPLRLEPFQVTISEAARLLAYDARTIRRLIDRGELTAIGQGRMRRVPVQSLRDYQQRHLVK
jgi:excisionase family DNA binding protein